MPKLQDLLTAVRLRRDLDLPNGAKDIEDDQGVSRPAPGRHKRKLVNSNLPNFQLWPANQPIFDGTHSESYSKMINLIWNVWQLCESFFSIFLMANVANIVKGTAPTNILRVQLSEGKSSDSWNIHTLRKRDGESIVPGRDVHTGLRQGLGPIVYYSSSPVPSLGPSPVPVRCEQAISHTVCSKRVFCSTPANRVT